MMLGYYYRLSGFIWCSDYSVLSVLFSKDLKRSIFSRVLFINADFMKGAIKAISPLKPENTDCSSKLFYSDPVSVK